MSSGHWWSSNLHNPDGKNYSAPSTLAGKSRNGNEYIPPRVHAPPAHENNPERKTVSIRSDQPNSQHMDVPRHRIERSRNSAHCRSGHHDHRGHHRLDQPLSRTLIPHQSHIPLHRWSRPHNHSAGQYVHSLRVRSCPRHRRLSSRRDQHRHGQAPAHGTARMVGVHPSRPSRHGSDSTPEPQLRRPTAHADTPRHGAALGHQGTQFQCCRPRISRRTSGTPTGSDWPH